MNHIRIKEIAIYHPETVVTNDYYINHFKERGRDITRFLDGPMGRDRRYEIKNQEENTLTMGITASKRVLEKAGLQGEDIDLVIFSTQVPETTHPCNAMYLHAAIEGDPNTIVYDVNANCAGMTLAIEQASRYMMMNPSIRRALIVGSDYNTLLGNPEQEISYACFGDAAAAVILESTEEEAGFLDAIYYTDSCNRDMIRFPKEGLAKSVLEGEEATSIDWLPFNGDMALPPTYEMFQVMLERNKMTFEDVDAFCFTQFSLGNIVKIQTHLNLDEEKIIYVGDEFGYTATSSPFIALHEGIQSGKIKRGDTVLFWTIGGGFQLAAMLLTY